MEGCEGEKKAFGLDGVRGSNELFAKDNKEQRIFRLTGLVLFWKVRFCCHLQNDRLSHCVDIYSEE